MIGTVTLEDGSTVIGSSPSLATVGAEIYSPWRLAGLYCPRSGLTFAKISNRAVITLDQIFNIDSVIA